MDDGHIWTELLIIFILIFLNAVCSMTEIAVVGARKTKLREMAKKGNVKAEYALRIAENPENLFSTIQIGITAIGILTGMFSGATLADPLADVLRDIPALAPYADGLSMTIVMILVSYATLILGELAPKWLAIAKSEEMSCLVAKPMIIFAKICYPLILFSNWSTKLVIRMIGVDMQAEKPVSEEEIRSLLLQGAGMGTFDKAEPILVDRIFRLDDLTAADCMTARTRLEWIDIDETDENIWKVLETSVHYRLPVGHESLDDFIGIIDISDVLRDHHKTGKSGSVKESVRRCLRRAVYIPETLTLLKILRTFREESVHEAIVIDEYGSFSGYISLHDILEEIVGDMPGDEEEKLEDSNRILQRTDGTFLVEGLCSIDDFREYFHIEEELPGEAEDYYKTVGGFIVYLLGYIPKETETIDYERFRFEIVDLDRRRIDKILVRENVS
jgi:putative hemolysin